MAAICGLEEASTDGVDGVNKGLQGLLLAGVSSAFATVWLCFAVLQSCCRIGAQGTS